MWVQLRRALKGLVFILVVVSLLQIGVTFIYVTSPSGRGLYSVNGDYPTRISVDWLRNASLSELRDLIARRLDPMGFVSIQLQDSQTAEQCHRPWTQPDGSFNLTHDTTQYFRSLGELKCLQEGTDFLVALGNMTRCPCRKGWSGVSCSIPDSVRYSNYPFKTEGDPKVRITPRRIIQAMPFNVEFEMLEARFAEVGDIVDVFMLLESNYTAYGDPKPLRLLDRLKAGYYADVACKIVHVFLDYFPKGADSNGWIADNIHRDYIASHGLAKQIKHYRLDDVFFLSDADELVSRENMLFLKLHDNWPEPVGFHLQRNTYGFFWRPNAVPVHIIGGVTIGVLTRVLKSKAISIRSGPAALTKHSNDLKIYQKAYPDAQKVNKLWSFGNKSHPAGFHCSWCCPAECMLIKLVSAQNGDFPRWGDYSAKRNLTYIRGIIQRGLWFDNKSTFKKGDIKTDFQFAPQHMLSNWEKYKHILVNPYVNKSLIISDQDLLDNTAKVLPKKSNAVTKPNRTGKTNVKNSQTIENVTQTNSQRVHHKNITKIS